EWHMRAWIGQVKKPLYDVRGNDFDTLYHPDPARYPQSQRFVRELRGEDPDAWGLVYRSVRHERGDCIAAFRPPAVSLPVQGPLLAYVWNGERVTTVYEKSEPLFRF
ncbi:MAG TPA: RES domain-containing protein, partial [Chromatiales bacterium]|nr:RES domain-containing protein [Chromatiales bacterium]